MIATFAFNLSVLLALILIPLFYPEALTGKSMIWLMPAPPAPEENPKPVARQEHAAPVQTEIRDNSVIAPTTIPMHIYKPTQREEWAPINAGDLAASSEPMVLPRTGVHPDVVPAPVGPQHISSGVAIGLLVHRVVPQYPPIPRAIRLEGTVVLQATISKSGTIENLRVVSGPPPLQRAALDAVAQWRYRPYLLNGQPIEVETTVNVEFRLQ